jgi:hypothetical protein
MVKTCKGKTFTSNKLATLDGLIHIYVLQKISLSKLYTSVFQTLVTFQAHSIIFLDCTVPILRRQSGLYS